LRPIRARRQLCVFLHPRIEGWPFRTLGKASQVAFATGTHSRFATSDRDGLIRLWDWPPQKQAVYDDASHDNPPSSVSGVDALSFAANDAVLLVADNDTRIRVLDVPSATRLGAWPGGRAQVTALEAGGSAAVAALGPDRYEVFEGRAPASTAAWTRSRRMSS
jgi:WD40 repeat protein